MYSGPNAGWAYCNIDPSHFERVFILGPGHDVDFPNCALTLAKYWETPLGNVEVDHETQKEIYDKGDFLYINKATDENEHSLELHLPFVQKVFKHSGEQHDFKLVPIMVGTLSEKKEKEFG